MKGLEHSRSLLWYHVKIVTKERQIAEKNSHTFTLGSGTERQLLVVVARSPHTRGCPSRSRRYPQIDAQFLWNWISSLPFMEDTPYSLSGSIFRGIPVKDASVKVVAVWGAAFLRNKNGAAIKKFFKTVSHPLRICGWYALRRTQTYQYILSDVSKSRKNIFLSSHGDCSICQLKTSGRNLDSKTWFRPFDSAPLKWRLAPSTLSYGILVGTSFTTLMMVDCCSKLPMPGCCLLDHLSTIFSNPLFESKGNKVFLKGVNRPAMTDLFLLSPNKQRIEL